MAARRQRQDRDPRLVVAYLRVSTQEQAEEGVSLESQDRAVRAHCIAHGLEVSKVICDAGVSASKPLSKRDGGQELTDIIGHSEVGGVVAMKLDRLFRSSVDCLTTVEAWKRRSVALHVLDMGGVSVDTSSAIGGLFLAILAAFGEMERRLISERTTAALATKRANGQQTGRVPYGYDVGPGGVLVPIESELATVAAIKAMRADGATYRGIVAALECDRVPPPRARHGGMQGAHWYPATVSRLAKRPDPTANTA